MFKYATRAAAVAALVPIALMMSAVPSHAQVEQGDVTVDGVATCDPATGTYTMAWTIDNELTVDIPAKQAQDIVGEAVTINTAVESEALTGDVLAGITPNPIPAFSTATVSDGPIANPAVHGQATLTVTWESETQKGTSSATVGFPNTCVVVVASTTVTTATPAVKTAVQAEPAFTG